MQRIDLIGSVEGQPVIFLTRNGEGRWEWVCGEDHPEVQAFLRAVTLALMFHLRGKKRNFVVTPAPVWWQRSGSEIMVVLVTAKEEIAEFSARITPMFTVRKFLPDPEQQTQAMVELFREVVEMRRQRGEEVTFEERQPLK